MRLPVLLFVALVLAAPAFAGALEDGRAAMKRGDWPMAVKLLQPLAEQGSAPAQMSIGDMYMTGHGFPKDMTEAMKWYHKAADQGNAAGQFNVGMGYKVIAGVTKDNTEAIKWLRKAADQGHGPAQLALSGIYSRGDGVKYDPEEAYFWFLLFRKSVPGGISNETQLATLEKLYVGDVTQEQAAAAKKRADEWKPVHAVPAPAAPAKP